MALFAIELEEVGESCEELCDHELGAELSWKTTHIVRAKVRFSHYYAFPCYDSLSMSDAFCGV